MSASPARTARRSYEQYCPAARALDVIGERWTLLIVRELLTGPKRFTDLRSHLPGMWANLLAPRLRELEAAGIVRRTELPPPAARTVYELADRGHALLPVLYELARWGLPYLDVPTEQQPLQPHLLTEGVRALVLIEGLPRRGLVVHVVLDDERDLTVRVAPPQPGPLVDRVTVEAGVPPRADVTMHTTLPVALRLRRGELSYADARRQHSIRVEGSDRAVAAALRMFGFDGSASRAEGRGSGRPHAPGPPGRGVPGGP